MSGSDASSRARALPALGRGALALGLLVAASGCYQTTNAVSMAALHTSYPVSASSQYLENDGTIVTKSDYRVVKSFDFTRSVEGKRHDKTETKLDLEPNLDLLVAGAHGSAVTHLKIEATDYHLGSHRSAARRKLWGWSFGTFGATSLVIGAVISPGENQHSPVKPLFLGMGGVSAALGVLSFVLGAVDDEPTAWRLRVSGSVVKRNAGEVQGADE